MPPKINFFLKMKMIPKMIVGLFEEERGVFLEMNAFCFFFENKDLLEK